MSQFCYKKMYFFELSILYEKEIWIDHFFIKIFKKFFNRCVKYLTTSKWKVTKNYIFIGALPSNNNFKEDSQRYSDKDFIYLFYFIVWKIMLF